MLRISVIAFLAAVVINCGFAAVRRVPSQYPTIQAGINAAVNGDTVLVADGTYTGAGNRSIDFLGRAILVTSVNGFENCVIDCQDSSRGFHFHYGETLNSRLNGFTINNGNTVYQDNGAGIYCESSSPTISNCLITNSTAGWDGGAICCIFGSAAVIKNCIMTGNSAPNHQGGAISLAYDCEVRIERCVITDNNALNGGGILVYRSNASIINCVISDNTVTGVGGGIECSSSSNTILMNSIVESNINHGIHFLSGSANATITYCDFHQNQGGDFQGTVPGGLGVISTVNNNGDPCDQYFNIFLDPLFQATAGDSAYRFSINSPCIDAGNPSSPQDPDSTFADMGVFYFHQSSLFIALELHNPPIVIPPGGGFINFDLCIGNTSDSQYIADVWSEITYSGGRCYGPVLSRFNLTVFGQAVFRRTVTQLVPPRCPGGNITYMANVGWYPDSVLDVAGFDFIKLYSEETEESEIGWTHRFWGKEKPESIDSKSEDNDFTLIVSPNPFNATTALSFKLQAASNIKLAVYDIAGREAAMLAEGFHPVRMHRALFDGTDLPSGVYFARLSAGQYYRTQKLLLIK